MLGRTDLSSVPGPAARFAGTATRAVEAPAAMLLAISLASCSESAQPDPSAWLGEACGVPDLRFTHDRRRKQVRLAEYQVQGTIRTEEGIGTAPVSDRQRMIERAMPCLEREARARGLTVDYPVMNVDA
ncbi:MAG TPA: hypothetical protein VF548_11985 [Allosphingosinicella sp.]|jgi:hypothetical protein